jgi:hypothetical protein
MSVLFKDLFIGIALVCLMLAFTSLTQARNFAPTETRMTGCQQTEIGNFESSNNCDRGMT